jgi:2-haloacid dehalogenase
MPKLDFHRFEVLSFDCYGTLIDWRHGILNAVRPVLSKHGVSLAEEKILETYSRYEAEIEAGPYRPYRDILSEVMVQICGEFGIKPTDTERDIIGTTLPDWPPFEDTVDALNALKTRYQLAIISNTDDDLFAGTNRRLEVSFDHIITAAQVGAYKPSPRVFEHALAKIGCGKGKLLHVAQSLYHDHVPAKKLGLSAVWINRRQALPSRVTTAARLDAEFPDLAALVKATGI